MTAAEIREAYANGIECKLIPDVAANGSDGPLTVARGEKLVLQVSLDPGSFDGSRADWWCIAETPLGLYHYDMRSASWRPGVVPTWQGAVFNLESLELLTTDRRPPGSYMIHFGVDLLMNGLLDLDDLIVDLVQIDVVDPE